jgi:hypothetical protein
LSNAHLLLAAGVKLSAEEILRLHARRWDIEPLFHNLKRCCDVNNLWQQEHIVLELWMQIRSTAWTMAQLLCVVAQDAFPITVGAPSTVDRRPCGTVDAYGIYRTFFQGRFQPEALDIHLRKTARRSKIAGIAPSSASSTNLVRFTPQLCHR